MSRGAPQHLRQIHQQQQIATQKQKQQGTHMHVTHLWTSRTYEYLTHFFQGKSGDVWWPPQARRVPNWRTTVGLAMQPHLYVSLSSPFTLYHKTRCVYREKTHLWKTRDFIFENLKHATLYRNPGAQCLLSSHASCQHFPCGHMRGLVRCNIWRHNLSNTLSWSAVFTAWPRPVCNHTTTFMNVCNHVHIWVYINVHIYIHR